MANINNTYRESKYLVEVRKTKSRLVNVYAKSASEAKKKAVKAVKNGDLSMKNTNEIKFNAVAKSPNNEFVIRNRNIVDLPSKYMDNWERK